jgi:bacteriophage N4 adsorption protein B
MSNFTAYVVDYRYYIEYTTIIAGIIIAISSFDDMLVDVLYWVTKFFGSGHAKERRRAADLTFIDSIREEPFAIMIPAWREHEVIFSMLTSNSSLLRYSSYHFFVGVYRNDRRTAEEVRRAEAQFPHIHMVTVERDGPTSKANCLNEIVGAIFLFEAKNKVSFAGIAMHDAEDLIHPHELKLFNFLISRYDFIQLPVFSFTCSMRNFVGGIYMDEFAESHTKDLVVRERMGAVIPCAGVSACFNRYAIALLADMNHGEVFKMNSFTEDYDIAVRVHELGMRTTFVSYPVGYSIDVAERTGAPFVAAQGLPIATREFFPSDLQAAYRQRARWLIGIIFQGIAEIGWRGGLATKYFLTRDRKSLITNPTVIVGYFVLVNLILIQLFLEYYGDGKDYPFTLLNSELVYRLFLLNLFFLVWRLIHRMFFTMRIYGVFHGLMSAPRLIIASFVNFFATMRATRIYLRHRRTGVPLVWDKTVHKYPFEIRDEGPRAPAHERRQQSSRGDRWRNEPEAAAERAREGDRV